jgi:hypothetical protein
VSLPRTARLLTGRNGNRDDARVTNRPTVRLSPDYGAESPLWFDGGNCQPEEIGLTRELGRRLAAWQAFFEERYHERGWRERHDREAFKAEGRLLSEALESEVGDRFVVVLDLWPVRRWRPRVPRLRA